jgi:hypothetical protein
MIESSLDLSIILRVPNGCSESALRATRKDIQSFFSKLPIKFELLEAPSYNLKPTILKAQGSFYFLMSAELSHPLAEMIVFLSHFYAHPDVQMVHGSRGLDPNKILFRETRFQKLIRSSVGRWIQMFCAPEFDDPICQFQAFRKASAQLIFSKQQSHLAVDIECLILAKKLNQKVETLAIRSTAREPQLKPLDWILLLWELLYLNLRVNRSTKD